MIEDNYVIVFTELDKFKNERMLLNEDEDYEKKINYIFLFLKLLSYLL